jgi:hypothetical protein
MSHQPVEVPTAIGHWLQDIPWQLFATLSFASLHVGYESARLKFKEMAHTVAHSMRTRLGYVYALERRSKSTGAIVPLHFHAAFVAPKPIEYQAIIGAWWAGAGGNQYNTLHDLARVQPYNSSLDGIAYIVKQMTDPDCQWDLKDVELFSPSMSKPRMSPRQARRWQEQHRLSMWLTASGFGRTAATTNDATIWPR